MISSRLWCIAILAFLRALSRLGPLAIMGSVQLKGQEYDATAFHSLPDEVITLILLQVDAVTRKRAERVCWRWCSLLRDSCFVKPTTCVKLDLSYLATTNASRFHDLKRVALRTIGPHTHSVLITDESNASAPWTRDQTSKLSLNLSMTGFFFWANGHSEFDSVRTMILRKVTLDKWDLFDFLRTYLGSSAGHNRCVELRRVKIQGLSLLRSEARDKNLVRREVSAVFKGQQSYNSATAAFFTALASGNAPRNVDEEKQYLQLANRYPTSYTAHGV